MNPFYHMTDPDKKFSDHNFFQDWRRYKQLETEKQTEADIEKIALGKKLNLQCKSERYLLLHSHSGSILFNVKILVKNIFPYKKPRALSHFDYLIECDSNRYATHFDGVVIRQQ